MKQFYFALANSLAAFLTNTFVWFAVYFLGLPGDIHYLFHENGDGFDIVSGKNFTHLAWENVRKVIERPQYFRFVFNQYESIIIPKRFLRHGSDEALMKEIIVSQVGHKAKLLGSSIQE